MFAQRLRPSGQSPTLWWEAGLPSFVRAVGGPAVLGTAALGATLGMSRWGHGIGSVGFLGAALVAVAFLSLVGRRQWPIPVFGVCVAAACAYLATDHPPGPIFLAPFWAILVVINSTASWRVWLGADALGGLALAMAHGVTSSDYPEAGIFLGIWLLVTATLGVGIGLRRRIRLEEAARARWAELSRSQEEGRLLAEERLRIAREVHDVVGHSLAVISLQAGVAEHLLESRPEEVRKAVSAIRRVSRQALGELRVELASLRDGSMAEGTAPTPGFGEIDGLVAGMREAGLVVEMTTAGDLRPLPIAVGTATYRIVQEALTNVARHVGAGTRVGVAIRRSSSVLEVEVVDSGSEATSSGPIPEGHGIAGMRERVAALGGRLEISRSGRGMRVLAQLPIPAA
jgi:signal transduction histidine kinase